METQIIITTMPDQDSALQLANHLVDTGLAACVNLFSPCTSVYFWRGKTETAREIPVFIKANTANYPAIEGKIKSLHPYELPEIITVPITGGAADYLQWLAGVSSSTPIPTNS